jgi:hypothetical protein
MLDRGLAETGLILDSSKKKRGMFELLRNPCWNRLTCFKDQPLTAHSLLASQREEMMLPLPASFEVFYLL